MINYIKAECGRLFKKKSNYIFYGVMMILFTVIAFMISSDMRTPNGFQTIINAMLPIVMAVLAIQIFIAVYSDDVSGNVLATVLSSGVSKPAFVVSKVIINLIYSIVVMIALGIFMGIQYLLVFKGSLNVEAIDFMVSMVKQSGLMIFAIAVYNSIGGIVLYLSQRTTVGITFLVTFTLGLITQILAYLSNVISILAEIVKWMPDYLYSIISEGLLVGEFDVMYVIALVIQLVVAVVVTIVVLRKKELEI